MRFQRCVRFKILHCQERGVVLGRIRADLKVEGHLFCLCIGNVFCCCRAGCSCLHWWGLSVVFWLVFAGLLVAISVCFIGFFFWVVCGFLCSLAFVVQCALVVVHWCLIFSRLCLGLVVCWCLLLALLVGVVLQFGGSLFVDCLRALFVFLGLWVLVLGQLLWCSVVVPCLVEASSRCGCWVWFSWSQLCLFGVFFLWL